MANINFVIVQYVTHGMYVSQRDSWMFHGELFSITAVEINMY
jgi:hypothetical protein